MRLGEVECGEVVKIGNRDFYVLNQGSGATAVLVKDPVAHMKFGGGGDWRYSDVRTFCNTVFYQELIKTIGKDNLFYHTVSLIADDGTGKGDFCRDDISILTANLYRRYRAFLPNMGGSAWMTATRVSSDETTTFSHWICHVDPRGVLGWSTCDNELDVRPYCILNSSILVS